MSRPVPSIRSPRHPRVGAASLIAALTVMALGCASTTTPPQGEAPQPGTPLRFEGVDLRSGERIDSASLAGKVVLVDFWASWCDPCRASLPFYDALQDRHRDAGLEVIGVSVDLERDLAERFIDRTGVRFRSIWDEGQRIVAAHPVPKMPTALLVDRQGIIRHVHAGFEEGSAAEIERMVETLISE